MKSLGSLFTIKAKTFVTGNNMLNPKKIEEIAKQVAEAIPPGLKNAAQDLEAKTKEVVQRKLSQLDVVSREEFDVQTQVLLKTRSKIEALEKKVAELEKLLTSDNN
jgi:BMFP domain-containing protein YqiC